MCSEQEPSIPDGWAAGYPTIRKGETCWLIKESCPNCDDGPLGSNGHAKWCDRCSIHTIIDGE